MNETKRVSEVVQDAAGRLERLYVQCQSVCDRLREHAADKPTVIQCERHPGRERRLDWDASQRATWQALEFVLVYRECTLCAEERQDVCAQQRLKSQGVPDSLLHCSLGNFRPRSDAQRAALQAVGVMLDKRRGFAFLCGDPGQGKSHLGVGALRKYKVGLFVDAADDFLARLRERYDNKRLPDIVKDCIRAPLLVLDDVGAATGANDEAAALHRVMNHRYNAKLPTVVTSNLTPCTLLEAIGTRIGDRLRDAAAGIVDLRGESARGERDYFQD